jgi:hypothetical protein
MEKGKKSEVLPSFYLAFTTNVSHPRSMYQGVPRALTLQSLDEMGTFLICSGICACGGRSLGHSRITNRSFMRV